MPRPSREFLAVLKKKYAEYAARHGTTRMPERGYGISGYLDRLAGHYTAFFEFKDKAIMAAQLLADATREDVELVEIQARGRFVIGEISPDPLATFQKT